MEQYKQIERSIITTYRKCVWRKFIKGINEYKMINEGDKIAVCISGGRDSTLMAKCVQEIHRHGVVKFDLEFITNIGDCSEEEKQRAENNAKQMNIPLRTFRSPRGIDSLLGEAARLGCNKIALGSHFDDVIEAILYGMLYKGKIETLMPKEHIGGMELIRPMYMVKEKDVTAWARYSGLEFPQDEENTEVKALIKKFRKTSPYIDMNVFNSVQNVNLTTVIAYSGKGKEYNFLDDYDERGK